MGNRRNSGVLDLFNIGIIPKIYKIGTIKLVFARFY